MPLGFALGGSFCGPASFLAASLAFSSFPTLRILVVREHDIVDFGGVSLDLWCMVPSFDRDIADCQREDAVNILRSGASPILRVPSVFLVSKVFLRRLWAEWVNLENLRPSKAVSFTLNPS